MQWVFIDEDAFQDASAFHEFIAEELGFPEHYGRNLDALNDCLTDIDNPVCFMIERHDFENTAGAHTQSWFDRVCTVLYRSAHENSAITVMDASEFGDISDSPDDID